ncbi:hypothetical protein TanjilG_04156 [Lupinus angustifolius]|uniref:S-protein homolog n=1 Tax=Lupinus angustifolius TaxID=3871 RepID=A0A4P1RJZ0_LUPAN|nr:hypothetical protein TanjilG_04156 [Lupinus angustifolius]
MASVVYGGLLDNTKITITNKLSQSLTIHCQDKGNDDGYHTLNPNESHRFKFLANPFNKKTLWFCSFKWNGKFHRYDIYDERTNSCYNYNCFWLIKEDGPCQIIHSLNDSPLCFSWKE